MPKKLVLLSVLVALVAGGAFVLPEFKVSAGAGGYFTSDFGGGYEMSASGQITSSKTPYFGGGGFAFFDATFAELSLGYFGGGGTIKDEYPAQSIEIGIYYMGLDIGLLGKYPFVISDQLSIFPALGVTYRFMLSVKDGNGVQYENSDGEEAPEYFSALWFKFGGGLDFAFTGHIYLHGGVLYGLRLANKYENDGVDTFNNMQAIDTNKTLLGHGLEVKIAVGYRF
jgi:hypothetical protein